jgi:Tfp pilus tip-associated adhesin PilY1
MVGGLRQGGAAYYALDVTQPDDIDTTAGPGLGTIVGSKDASPGCLNGGGGSCVNKYPEALWELTDNAIPRMGETWSRPVLGRIRIIDGGAPSGFSDRYVALFGGGFDPTHQPGDAIRLVDGVQPATRGRAFYIVDVETGKVLHKAVAGVDGDGGAAVDFAPMPATPGVVDWDNDGYLDVAYIGDVNGRMWRIELGADPAATPPRGELVSGALEGYQPFLLFDSTISASGAPIQPVFQEPGVIFVSGGARPRLGVAWGSGNRAELEKPNVNINRFFFVLDDGQAATTFDESVLRNLTPTGGVTPAGAGPGPDAEGFFLDFASANEKASSTVFSTVGFLTMLTFTPDQSNPCATEGSSFQYRFFFLSGEGGFNVGTPAGDFTDYRSDEGSGLASLAQSTTSKGRVKNMILRSDGSIDEEIIPGSLRTLTNNWKEQ